MRILIHAIKIILLIAAAVFVFGSIVMLLWNWLIPDLFNGPELSFIQALGILVLARILTGGMGHGSRGGKGSCSPGGKKRWQKKWEELPEDKKEKIREKMSPFRDSARGGSSEDKNEAERAADTPFDEE